MSDFEEAVKPARQEKSEPLLPNFDELRRKEPPQDRLARFPDSVGVGDYIVGSTHTFNLVHPRITTRYGTGATAMISIRAIAPNRSRGAKDELGEQLGSARRASTFAATETQVHIRDGVPIQMTYSPTFVGEHEANVEVALLWDDGVRDTRVVRVHGAARNLEDAPREPPTSFDREAYREPEKVRTADLRGIDTTPLSNAFHRARKEAHALAKQQELGVHRVESEVGSYQKHEEKPSFAFEVLVEAAVAAGVAGVAGIAARFVATRLASKLAALGPAGRSKELERYAEVGIADTVKDGLKNAARKPIVQAILATDSDNSMPNKIEFFDRQERGLASLADENEGTVLHQHEELQHGLLSNPGHAVAAMEAIEEGYAKAKETAREEQAHQTRMQWMTYVARAQNGRTAASVRGRRVETTNLSKATGETRGALRIRVGADGRVLSASIEGVPNAVARDLLTTNLRTAAIPIVVLNGEVAPDFITRDEVGRVRRAHYPRDLEIQHHAEAQQIMDRVTSMTLAQWGVRSIATDDRGDS